MTNLTLITILAVALAAVLALALRRTEEPGLPGPVDDVGGWDRLPRRSLIDRFLATADIDYVASLRLPGIFKVLIEERRRLALEWLRATRTEARRIIQLHARSARHSAELAVSTEFRLYWQYANFVLVYYAAVCLLQIYGPRSARRVVRSVGALTDRLASLGGGIADIARPVAVPAGGR
jgi:hypothetical protein